MNVPACLQHAIARHTPTSHHYKNTHTHTQKTQPHLPHIFRTNTNLVNLALACLLVRWCARTIAPSVPSVPQLAHVRSVGGPSINPSTAYKCVLSVCAKTWTPAVQQHRRPQTFRSSTPMMCRTQNTMLFFLLLLLVVAGWLVVRVCALLGRLASFVVLVNFRWPLRAALWPQT